MKGKNEVNIDHSSQPKKHLVLSGSSQFSLVPPASSQVLVEVLAQVLALAQALRMRPWRWLKAWHMTLERRKSALGQHRSALERNTLEQHRSALELRRLAQHRSALELRRSGLEQL